MTSKVDRAGKTWSYEYDLRGNQTKQIDPLGNDTWFCYDLNDNQTLVVLPKQGSPSCSLTENDVHVTRRTYDARDLLSSVLTKSGTQLRKATYSYYDDGQLKEVFEPRSFDSSGNLLSTVQKATYVRYPNNRVKAFIDEEGNTTEITYTPNGLPHVVKEPPNSDVASHRHIVRYGYNRRGQVSSIHESAIRIPPPTPTICMGSAPPPKPPRATPPPSPTTRWGGR